MRAFLLTWNKDRWNDWPGGSYHSFMNRINQGKHCCIPWETANTSVQSGDRVYLMKIGSEQGIIAKGRAITGPFIALHWDEEKAKKGMTIRRILVDFVGALDYENNNHIKLNLLRNRFPEQNWTPWESGIAITESFVGELEKLWNNYFSHSHLVSKNDKRHDETGTQEIEYETDTSLLMVSKIDCQKREEMSSKKLFSKQEAVLLLNAFLSYMHGKLSRKQAIDTCSFELRRIAKLAGNEIDEKFRNVAGITFQMESMESAYKGETVRKPSTRLFDEVVSIYRRQREEYYRILHEAKELLYGGVNDVLIYDSGMAESLKKTIITLNGRFNVRIEYNHLAYPVDGWAYDIYYVVDNGIEEIMGVYYLKHKTHYISIETEQKYIAQIQNSLQGFYRTQIRSKHTKLEKKK